MTHASSIELCVYGETRDDAITKQAIMNTRFTFLTISSLALTLALLAPCGVLAEGKDPANPSAAPGSGRQAIRDKLERIRLDSVQYQGLPLSEVVFVLRDEAKKRDPEKKGINFLITQNVEPNGAAMPGMGVGPDGNPVPAPPQEAVDVGGIQIKIYPPLNDVRLLDVLDAVVAVADHPIKYTIEDYGVLLSLRGTPPVPTESLIFSFPGGTPSEFLKAVEDQCKVDWISVAEIPKEMADVRIPRLRIQPDSPMPRPNGERVDPLTALVSLYNQLGEQKPELGRLLVKGDMAKPAVVMFVPDKATADSHLRVKVKAFSLWGISDTERVKLAQDIDRARDEAMAYALNVLGNSGVRNLEGTVSFHKETSILVARGSESFVEMVESIVSACQAKERARNPAAPAGAPAAR
jgi:hypothetical protein